MFVTNRWHRKARALIALALTAGMGLVAIGASSAGATTTDPSYGNVDGTREGSIVIHKGKSNSSNSSTSEGNKGTPSGTAPAGFQGLADVKFTAYKLTDVDLTTAAGWDSIKDAVIPANACVTPSLAGHTLDSGTVSASTDANGLTTITKGVGAYLVCETSSPAAVVDKAQPFLVTIPFPDNAASKGWLYNVHTWPKNGLAFIPKSVTSQTDLGLGSVAKFPVTSVVPKIASNANFKYFIVSDPMDSRLTSPGVDTVTLDGATVPTANYTVTTSSNTVNVSFTQAGLTYLKANPGKSLVITFKGTVSSLGDGVIPNVAKLYTDTQVSEEPPTTPRTTPPTDPPGIPSNEVKQYWGDLVIKKVDKGNMETGLAGAKFEVYAADSPYAETCAPTPTGSALSVNGATEFTTEANGQVKIAGLFVSDSVNPPINVTKRCYVIKETVAPAGYVTPTGAAALSAVTVNKGATQGVDITISNTKTDVPELPLTGSSAQLMMMLIGGALVLIAGGAVVVSRSRRNRQ